MTFNTPVDTGRARASWTIAVNQANRHVMPEGRYPAMPNPGFLDVRPGDSVVISNNLPYITALENGHSRQAPFGMVAVSIQEVRTNMGALIGAAIADVGL